MKVKLRHYIMVCCLAGLTCDGGIPEAPIVLYGVVRQNIGSGVSVRKTHGEVSVTAVPPTGESITVVVELDNINDQFCYAMQLPCESLANATMNASSNTLMLAPISLSYSFTDTEIDGQAAQVVGSDAIVLSHKDRGSFQRLDLLLTTPPQDTDGDGISDDWELAYFYGAANPGDDPDGDGVSNLNEYLAGSDPWDASSYLAFVDVQQGADIFTIRWESQLNRYYRIERSASLLEGFTPIATGIPGTPPVNEFRDAGVPDNQNAFYRIVVE